MMFAGKPSDSAQSAPDPTSGNDQAIPFAGGEADAQPMAQPEIPGNMPSLKTTPESEPPVKPFEIIDDDEPTPVPPAAAATDEVREESPAASDAPCPAITPFWQRLLWKFMPVILMLAGFGSVLLTQKGVGFAWDEAYYYEPSLKAAGWLTEVVHGHKPFSKAAIDAAWAGPGGAFGQGYQEHPSLMKFLCGLSLKAFPDPKLQLWAMRLPIAILFGLTLSLIYLLGRQAWGAAPGLIAALLYATMPRIFGHAHFASLETPLVFMMLLTVFCFLRGLERPGWAALTGVSFGLLLATKLNGFFLPIPLVLWAHLYARKRYVDNLFAMLTLGPVVFVLAWPWLWPDPVMRLLQYLAFHAQHQLTAVFFMGKTWGYDGPNAPWYYPLAVTGATLPLAALLLGGLGIGRTVLAPRRQPLGALYLVCALVMLLVASAPSTPKYDGERLFLALFPFLALLGGSGAAGLVGWIENWVAKRGGAERATQTGRRWAAAWVGLLVLLEGGLAIYRYHPYLLSYYNPLVGGVRGAYEGRLFETTYWGESLNDAVIGTLNGLPPGASIKPLALHAKCLELLQRWGVLKQDLLIDQPKQTTANGRAVEYYDYHLLQFRQGFFRRPERTLAGSDRFKVKTWGWGSGLDQVPMIGLYRTGPEFELFWHGE